MVRFDRVQIPSSDSFFGSQDGKFRGQILNAELLAFFAILRSIKIVSILLINYSIIWLAGVPRAVLQSYHTVLTVDN